MRKRDKKNEIRCQKLLFGAYKGLIVELYQNHCPNEMILTSNKRNPKITGATLRNVNEYQEIIHMDYNVNLNIDK